MICAGFWLPHSGKNKPDMDWKEFEQLQSKSCVCHLIAVGHEPQSLWRRPTVTTALNTLVLIRIDGLQFAHGAGRDNLGPLLIGLAVVGGLIWALTRVTRTAV
jgi:hypothetical protein